MQAKTAFTGQEPGTSSTTAKPVAHGRLGEPEAVFHYRDTAGQVVLEVYRFKGKRFLQRDPRRAPGEWKLLDDTPRPLYRLPQLLEHIKADSRKPIYVVEGEKDVQAVEAAGATATTSPMGAGRWLPEHAETLAGARRLVIVVDKDDAAKRASDGLTPGEKHVKSIVESLGQIGFAGTVELVQAVEGKDAADHLAAGHTLDELVPYELPTGPTADVATDEQPLFVDAYDFVTMQIDQPEPLWGTANTTILPAGGLAIFAGRPGVGKTTFLLDLICHLACGIPYPPKADDKSPEPWPIARPLRIALIENEGPIAMFRDKLYDKLAKFGQQGNDIRKAGGFLAIQTWRWGAFNFADPDAFDKAHDELERLKIDLVVGDPLGMLGVEGVGSPADTRTFVQILRRLGLGETRSFLFLHHFRERAERNEDEMARVSGAWNTHLDTLITLSAMGAEDQARLAFPKIRWAKERQPDPVVLGRVFNTASFESLRQEGDLSLLEPVIADFFAAARAKKRGAAGQGWYTATELAAAMKQAGDGRRRTDIQKALNSGGHLFVARTGEDARTLGKRATSVLWGLREWEVDESEPAPHEGQQHLVEGES